MKTVGIITVHRLSNWGSAMQAYALQKVIENLGFQVQVIDYQYPNSFHWARGAWRPYKLSLKTRVGIFLRLRAKPKQWLINDFISQEMNVSRRYETFEDLHSDIPLYDIYCTGSDQIWNYKTMYCDTTYMLDFVPSSCKCIAYASSFSVSNIPIEYQDLYKKNLLKFSSLSVREQNGSKIIYELLNRKAKVVLDPTLLLNRNHWIVLAQKAYFKKRLPSRYILCYMLGYTYDPTEAMNTLLIKLQNKYQCPVISIGNPLKNFAGSLYMLPKSQAIGIYEFLYLMKNCTVFATSSFHGTVFSVNLGVPFVSLVDNMEQEDDRIISLLDKMGLSNHIVTTDSDYDCLNLDAVYDVEKVHERLELLRKDSMDYLKKALNDD